MSFISIGLMRILKGAWLLAIVVLLIPTLYPDFAVAKKRHLVKVKKSKLKLEDYSTYKEYWVDSVFETFSTREKIGQLMMVAAFSRKDRQNVEEIETLVKNYGIGGVIFMRGGPVAQAKLTNRYQSISKVPLMVGIDGEWGLSMRLDSVSGFPKQMLLGAIDNDSLIYKMGKEIARQCKLLRININFAPTVDINSNPKNPVINVRSFGEDRELVSQKGIAYMRGMQDNGIIACAKHFPGHGETDVDSHQALPFVGLSRQRLDSVELYPFKRLIAAGLKGVMVGHLSVPALEPNLDNPTSISRKVITDLLKGEYGFNGLVFSDALNMKGISASRSPQKVCADALRAGNDVLLFPEDVAASIRKIEWELFWGRIDEKELNARVKKVLSTKFDLGLNRYVPIDLSTNLLDSLNQTKQEMLKEEMAAKAMTLLSNTDKLIPLKRLDTLKIAMLSCGEEPSGRFAQSMGEYARVTNFSIGKVATQALVDSLKEELQAYNLIVTSIVSNESRPSKSYGIDSLTVSMLGELAERQKVVVAYFGSPYALSYFPYIERYAALVVGYQVSDQALKVVPEMIFGARPIKGKLPITVSTAYKYGDGIELDSVVRIRNGFPEEVGVSRQDLVEVEAEVAKAMEKQAIPGCQVLAMKDGVIFYNKNFGAKTYYGDDIVKSEDIYDVASVTKVAATLPVLIKMADEGKVDINKNLGSYLPTLRSTNKSDLKLTELLSHQAGLPAGISIYPRYLRSLFVDKPLYSSTISEGYPFKVSESKFQNRYYTLDKKMFGAEYSVLHPLQVATSIYVSKTIRDTIFNEIARCGLDTRGEYKYSDLSYYFYQRMIEDAYHKTLDKVADSLFYKKLGMVSTMFNPFGKVKLEQVVPTEMDYTFRNQLIHGFVHDPGAALMGGVAGHAGLFSNATDLAKLMQLYLNKGTYGGERYFSDSTFGEFNKQHFKGNRRALGFDKPETDSRKESPVDRSLSPESYGHTGFTGTMVWVDPSSKLVFIFLSNRVYPSSQENKLSDLGTRTKVLALFNHMVTRLSAK